MKSQHLIYILAQYQSAVIYRSTETVSDKQWNNTGLLLEECLGWNPDLNEIYKHYYCNRYTTDKIESLEVQPRDGPDSSFNSYTFIKLSTGTQT